MTTDRPEDLDDQLLELLARYDADDVFALLDAAQRHAELTVVRRQLADDVAGLDEAPVVLAAFDQWAAGERARAGMPRLIAQRFRL